MDVPVCEQVLLLRGLYKGTTCKLLATQGCTQPYKTIHTIQCYTRLYRRLYRRPYKAKQGSTGLHKAIQGYTGLQVAILDYTVPGYTQLYQDTQGYKRAIRSYTGLRLRLRLEGPSIVKANVKLDSALSRHVNLVADNLRNKSEYMTEKSQRYNPP